MVFTSFWVENHLWGLNPYIYREAIRITSNHAEAQNNLGLLLLEKGNDQEAIRHLNRAVQTKPVLAEAHYNLGRAKKGIGRH